MIPLPHVGRHRMIYVIRLQLVPSLHYIAHFMSMLLYKKMTVRAYTIAMYSTSLNKQAQFRRLDFQKLLTKTFLGGHSLSTVPGTFFLHPCLTSHLPSMSSAFIFHVPRLTVVAHLHMCFHCILLLVYS